MRGMIFGFATTGAAALALAALTTAALTTAALTLTAPAAAQETPEAGTRTKDVNSPAFGSGSVRDFLSNFGVGASASQNLGPSVVEKISLVTLNDGDLILATEKFANSARDYVLEVHSMSNRHCGALKTDWIRGCGVYAQLGVSMDDNDIESLGLGFMIGLADLVDFSGTDINLGFGVNTISGAKKVNRTFVSESLGGGVFVIDPRFADEIRSGALSPLKDQDSVRLMITLSVSPRRSKAR